MSDFGAVDAVLHQQDLQFSDIVDQEFLEASWEHVAGALVGTITNVWHQILSLEATTYSVVNTLGLAPFVLHETKLFYCNFLFIIYSFICTYRQLGIAIRLVADEVLGALLHDIGPVCWANGHFGAIFKETFLLDLATNFPGYMAKMSTKFVWSKHLVNNAFKRN